MFLNFFSNQELFSEEFSQVNLGKLRSSKTSSEIIPTFFNALPTENDELKQKLREEARAQFLQVMLQLFSWWQFLESMISTC